MGVYHCSTSMVYHCGALAASTDEWMSTIVVLAWYTIMVPWQLPLMNGCLPLYYSGRWFESSSELLLVQDHALLGLVESVELLLLLLCHHRTASTLWAHGSCPAMIPLHVR